MKYYFRSKKDKEMYEVTVVDSRSDHIGDHIDVKRFEIHKSLLVGADETLNALGYNVVLPELFDVDCSLRRAISKFEKMKKKYQIEED